MKITKNTRNLILFMAFGDGYIQNGLLRIRHSVKQKEYLEWKMNLLRKSGVHTSDIYYVDNNGYGAYEFYTSSYDFIKNIRKYLYTPKKNIAQNKQLNKLTPLGLYIWYLDDGGLSQSKDKNGNIRGNTLMINTMLTKDENQIIIDYFKGKWNIQFRQCKNHGKYRLECGTKEARKFIEIIKPYKNEVDCMLYKFKVKPKSTTRQNRVEYKQCENHCLEVRRA